MKFHNHWLSRNHLGSLAATPEMLSSYYALGLKALGLKALGLLSTRPLGTRSLIVQALGCPLQAAGVLVSLEAPQAATENATICN
jgi:hypothetical protein